jgi:hypothetical protein
MDGLEGLPLLFHQVPHRGEAGLGDDLEMGRFGASVHPGHIGQGSRRAIPHPATLQPLLSETGGSTIDESSQEAARELLECRQNNRSDPCFWQHGADG